MKLFIKDDYEGLLFSRKVRAYWDLLRPFTLVAPMVGSCCAAIGGLIATDGWERFDLFTLFFGCLTLALLNGASNVFNQYTDIEADTINKPYRPIPRGIVTRKEALSIAIVLYGATIIRSIWINPVFASMVICLVVSTVIYSAGIRTKDKLWFNNTTIAYARGGLGLLAGWSILTPKLTAPVLLIALMITVFLVGMTSCKDLSDVIGDIKSGTRTVPVVYGEHKSLQFVLIFALAALVIGMMTYYFHFTNIISVVLGNIYVISAITLIFGYKKWFVKTSAHVENNRAWTLMYATIGVSYLLFPFMLLDLKI